MDRQLALGFKLREDISLSTFIPGNNSQAITDLTTTARGIGEPLIYLWGGKSTGKSHLLQAACQLADSEERPAVYIPLQQAELFQPDILNDLESLKLVCLDDLQRVTGDPGVGTGDFSSVQQTEGYRGKPSGSGRPGPVQPANQTTRPSIPPRLGTQLPVTPSD